MLGVPAVAAPPPRASKAAVNSSAMLQLAAHLNMHIDRCPRMRRLWRNAAIRSSFEPRFTSFMSLKGEKNLNKTCNTSVLAD